MNAVLRAPAPNRRLVSIDPPTTCVPLEPLLGYAPVFASAELDADSDGKQLRKKYVAVTNKIRKVYDRYFS